MTRRRVALAGLLTQLLVVVGVSCGVPTGEATLDEIDGDVLGGLNDPTTTTTTTTTTTPAMVKEYLDTFAEAVGVDELMTVHPAPTVAERLHSVELLADVNDPVTV